MYKSIFFDICGYLWITVVMNNECSAYSDD
jgi:hypothetical protein